MIAFESLEIPEAFRSAVTSKVIELKQNPLIQNVLNEQQQKLPDDLHYHTFAHIDEVFHETVLLALHDKRPESDIELLGLAAAFHDAGFIERRTNNEVLGADLARERLLATGRYTKEDANLVHQMILDTALAQTPQGLKQIPSTALSEYLLDADLANFGRSNFFERAEAQRREIGEAEKEFYIKTLSLVELHSFFTPAALKIRQATKEKNLLTLKKKIATL